MPPYRFFVPFVVAVLSLWSLVAPKLPPPPRHRERPRPSACTDLEVGTFFGADWTVVEDQVRSGFRLSLAAVREACSADSTCPEEQKKFCGYDSPGSGGHHSYNYDLDEYVMKMEQGNSVRHLYDSGQCERVGEEGDDVVETLPGTLRMKPSGTATGGRSACFATICLDKCFRDKVAPPSEMCNSSLREARRMHRLLLKVEDAHDDREAFFRYSVASIVFLSAVAGVLVVLLRRCDDFDGGVEGGGGDEDDAPCISACATLCVGMNWIMVSLLLGFVTAVCPIFLVILVPPYATVQLIHYGCFSRAQARRSRRAPVQIRNATVVDPDSDELRVALMAVPIQVV